MTRRTNSMIAGFTFLFYIAVAFPSMVLFGRATRGDTTAASLASIAQHVLDIRVTVVLALLSSFSALVLAVSLYGITREVDNELAVLGMSFRIGEGVVGAVSLLRTLGLLWLATALAAPAGTDAAGVQVLGAYLFELGAWSTAISATLFAVGSTIFSYLLLRGRMIPVSLAWLGVVASGVLVVLLPAELTGFFRGPITQLAWIPMAVFEIIAALWLIIRGAAAPAQRQSA